MRIIISNSFSDPIYEQIVSQIKSHVIKGELQEGQAPPVMRFSMHLLIIGISTMILLP
jgi:DNA-binding transcriptional regulator YhcF (GntR family)